MTQILVAWLVLVNLATFAAYWWDKRAARRGDRRTRERTLLLMNLAGGFVGGWAGMLLLRHKTLHVRFRIVQSVATVAWIVLLLGVLLGS